MATTLAVLMAFLLSACGGQDYRPVDIAELTGPDGTLDVGDQVSTEGYLLRFKSSDELMICMGPPTRTNHLDTNGCLRVSSTPTVEDIRWRDDGKVEFSPDLVAVKGTVQALSTRGSQFVLSIQSWQKVDQ